ALFGELLHPVVQAIHHVEVIVRIEGHTRGAVEFAIPAPGGAPLAEPGTIPGEDRNAIVPLIRHVDIAGCVQGNRGWPHEAAIGRLFLGAVSTDTAAKFSDVLLVHGADGNALAIWSPLVGAIEHIEPVAGVTGDAHRGAEPRSGELGTADGMAVLQLYG